MNTALVTLVACMMIWGAQSVLKVTCGTTGCPGACSSFGCIRFQIPEVNYVFHKCLMNGTDCTGITQGDFSLYKCSGVADPTNSMYCSNQCCYFHPYERKNVCLAPPAIGLVNEEYSGVCAKASRNLYQEMLDLLYHNDALTSALATEKSQRETDKINLQKQIDSIQSSSIAAIALASIQIVIGLVFAICKYCRKRQEDNPNNQIGAQHNHGQMVI